MGGHGRSKVDVTSGDVRDPCADAFSAMASAVGHRGARKCPIRLTPDGQRYCSQAIKHFPVVSPDGAQLLSLRVGYAACPRACTDPRLPAEFVKHTKARLLPQASGRFWECGAAKPGDDWQ